MFHFYVQDLIPARIDCCVIKMQSHFLCSVKIPSYSAHIVCLSAAVHFITYKRNSNCRKIIFFPRWRDELLEKLRENEVEVLRLTGRECEAENLLIQQLSGCVPMCPASPPSACGLFHSLRISNALLWCFVATTDFQSKTKHFPVKERGCCCSKVTPYLCSCLPTDFV